MKFRLYIAALHAALFCLVLAASPAGSGSMLLTGVGPPPVVAGGGYTGPGDVFTTSPYAAYSCSEAFNAAGANTSTSACDLVDSAAPTVVICTLRFTSSGTTDLSAYCPGSVTPAAKCAAATGGVCNLSQVYDLTGNGRHVVATVAANQPTLTFSSTPAGTLPAINCGNATPSLSMQTVATFTLAQPFTMSAVMIRNSGTAAGGTIGGILGSNIIMGSAGGASLAQVFGGNALIAAATDSTWFSLQGLFNSTSGAINVNGSDTIGNTSTAGFAAGNIRICRANSGQLGGLIAEAIIWATSTTSTDRNAISANQHSSGRYNF